MTTTQYVGARYVPKFAEPDQWDGTRAYEPLTIVLYQGNSYTTRQYTPAGIDIANEEFWAETGNYNAQVELYREEVKELANVANSSVRKYSTVADMQSADLNINDIVITEQYNVKALTLWTVISEGTESFDTIKLSNGKYAKAILSEFVNPESIGAYGDGIHDDSEVFKFILSNNHSIKLSRKNYLLNQSITVRSNNIVGPDYSSNDLYYFNNTPAKLTLSNASLTVHGVFNLCGFSIDGNNTDNPIVVEGCNGGFIRNLSIHKSRKSAVLITSVDSEWVENLSFENVLITNCGASAYEFDLTGSGFANHIVFNKCELRECGVNEYGTFITANMHGNDQNQIIESLTAISCEVDLNTTRDIKGVIEVKNDTDNGRGIIEANFIGCTFEDATPHPNATLLYYYNNKKSTFYGWNVIGCSFFNISKEITYDASIMTGIPGNTYIAGDLNTEKIISTVDVQQAGHKVSKVVEYSDQTSVEVLLGQYLEGSWNDRVYSFRVLLFNTGLKCYYYATVVISNQFGSYETTVIDKKESDTNPYSNVSFSVDASNSILKISFHHDAYGAGVVDTTHVAVDFLNSLDF